VCGGHTANLASAGDMHNHTKSTLAVTANLASAEDMHNHIAIVLKYSRYQDLTSPAQLAFAGNCIEVSNALQT
jgi:hypothetical protein